jgi:hypothetical protein
MEGHADPPDHAPHDLTGGGFRIDDSTGRNRVNNTRHADDAELLVHRPNESQSKKRPGLHINPAGITP